VRGAPARRGGRDPGRQYPARPQPQPALPPARSGVRAHHRDREHQRQLVRAGRGGPVPAQPLLLRVDRSDPATQTLRLDRSPAAGVQSEPQGTMGILNTAGGAGERSPRGPETASRRAPARPAGPRPALRPNGLEAPDPIPPRPRPVRYYLRIPTGGL